MEMTKKMKMAAVGVAAVAVVGGGVFAYTRLAGGDPKETVIQAFENVYTEGQTNPMEELFGLSEFAKAGISASQNSGLMLKLDSCSEPAVNTYAGSGLRIDAKNDVENNKVSANMGIIYNGMDLVNLDFYYGDDTVMAAVPELSSKVFTLDFGEGLEERLKNSPMLGPALEQSGVNVSVMTEYMELLAEQARQTQEGQAASFDLKALMKRYQEGCKAEDDFKAALTVEKGEKASFTIDGKEQACRGYEVTVSKEAMINFLRTSSDFFLQDEILKKDFLNRLELSVKLSQLAGAQMEGQDFPTAQEMQEQTYEEARTEIDGMIAFLDSSLNDVSMTVHVDKEGRLASVKGTTSFNSTGAEAEPVQLQFGCELKGGAYPTQNMSAQAVLENGAASVQIEAVKEGAYDGKELTSGFELSIENQGEIAEKWDITLDSSYNSEGGGFDVQAAAAQDGMELLGFSAQGVVDELEKGKNIHLTLDSLDVSAMGDTGNAVLSGEYYIRPLTEEVVPLEGDTMDVLAAGEEEWNSVLMEVLFSFISLSGQMDTGN